MATKALLAGELVIAVDFDGTISTDPNMAKFEDLVLQPECKRVLFRMFNAGIKLILWTCRSGKVLDEALEFLMDSGVLHCFVTINDQLPEINEKYAPDVARKIGADVYIDDKSVMTTINWLDIENAIFGNTEPDWEVVKDEASVQ